MSETTLPEQTPPVLSVRNLDVRYGDGTGAVHAVRDVSLYLAAGQTIGIAGESGSGKTTLALSLLRLLPATSHVTGTVDLNGTDLLTASWGAVRAVRWAQASIVFQGAMNALNPVQTIGDQLIEPIVLHERVKPKEAHERAADLLEKVGVPSRRMRDYPHELSGGQRQRVMIAMALACRPQLIVADEPTTALDVIVQSQILALITNLVRQEQISMIMISHDLAVLAQACDRLVIMYAGRVVEAGPAREVMLHPHHPYTRALADSFPTIGDPDARFAPTGLPGDPPDLRGHEVGCPFAPRCPQAQPVCGEWLPELIPTSDARSVACVRHEERSTAS